MEKKKVVLQLDTPYSATPWPQLSQTDQDIILELLCRLLSPIGRYRAEQVQPSKGKRDKKRKRNGASEAQGTQPNPPEVMSYIDVGLHAVTRRLQGGTVADEKSAPPFYSAVVVARSGQPSVLSSHLPQMIVAASQKYPSRLPTRLIGLSKACEDRLSNALGIPRVSYIGILDEAPDSEPLIDFVRQHVPIVKAEWWSEAREANHKETKINTIETVVDVNKSASKS